MSPFPPPPPLGLTMLLTVLHVLTTFTLTFGGLPATHQTQALEVLTVSLIPALGLKNALTPLTKTNSAT
ncbi:MAG: hypothetical protein O7D91_04255 [Planctomycetota bacterium]|nr:hypothetical protein [Planctomycetota bacterium]